MRLATKVEHLEVTSKNAKPHKSAPIQSALTSTPSAIKSHQHSEGTRLKAQAKVTSKARSSKPIPPLGKNSNNRPAHKETSAREPIQHSSAPPATSPTASCIHQMTMKNVPETFLKTRDALYVHIKILWGLIHEKAVPLPPCPDTLKEFYTWFSLTTEVEDAANNKAAPQLIGATEIKSVCNMRSR